MSDWREIKSFKEIDWYRTFLNLIPLFFFIIGIYCGDGMTDQKLNAACQKANNVYQCHVISILDVEKWQLILKSRYQAQILKALDEPLGRNIRN